MSLVRQTLACLALATTGLLAAPTAALAGPGDLQPSEALFVNQRIGTSCYYSTIMQNDGNLVTYAGRTDAAWASRTFSTGAYLLMQTDGNMVIYNKFDQPLWWTGTQGNPGAYAVQQDDGNLVVYRGNRALWASGIVGPSLGVIPCGITRVKTTVQPGVNLPGNDYAARALANPRASACGTMCASESQCKAWTYVAPTAANPQAMCWLKSAASPASPMAGVVSGIVR